MTQNKPDFRYDINALRVIAIIGVVLFHFHIPFFGGGFSGVDIFYVISGYLMTGIVFRGLNSETFSILEFYRKRVLRIIPALLFLICSIVAICFFIYLPADYQLVAKNATASLLFVSNLLYAIGTSYFAPSSDTNIFLHTWSLSVEWQFYLILPVVMVVANRYFRNSKAKFLVLFAGVSILSFLSALVLTRIYPTMSFYILPTRAWEMLAGGIAFLIEGEVSTKVKRYTPSVGYIILFSSVFFLNTELNWPGFYTLIPVLGTLLIVVGNGKSGRFLKSPVMLFIGKTSYSVYLWHWPVFVIATYLGIRNSIPVTILLIMLSVVLGFVSYYFVESPKIYRSRFIVAATLVLTCSSALLWRQSLNEWVFSKKTLFTSRYDENHIKERDDQFSKLHCYVNHLGKGFASYKKDECLCIEKNKTNIVLLGDSHAAHFSQSMKEAFKTFNVHLSQATATGCFPTIKENGKPWCSEIMHYAYSKFIPKNADDIDGVIISANWVLTKDNDRGDLVADLSKTIEYLEKLNIKPIILGQTQTYSIPFQTIAAMENEYKRSINENYVSTESESINAFLKQKFKSYYVDIYDLNNLSKTSPDGIPYMFDQNHFTKYGADEAVKIILQDKVFDGFLKSINIESVQKPGFLGLSPQLESRHSL